MFDSSKYLLEIVPQHGGPKFRSEAGCFDNLDEISTHSVSADKESAEHNGHTTATSFRKLHSGITSALVRNPSVNSRISGSDAKHQTRPVKETGEILRMPLSLFEMADEIRDIPSPRKRFFQFIVAVSGLTPNTVKMILCSTSVGIYPKEDIRNKIAKALGTDVRILFPEKRRQSGSIVSIYSGLSSKKVDFHRFIRLLSETTGSSVKTVRKWLKARRVPGNFAKKEIARVIGVSIIQLFPRHEGT